MHILGSSRSISSITSFSILTKNEFCLLFPFTAILIPGVVITVVAASLGFSTAMFLPDSLA